MTFLPAPCDICGKTVTVTLAGRYRKHNDPANEAPCLTSGLFVPNRHQQSSHPSPSAPTSVAPDSASSTTVGSVVTASEGAATKAFDDLFAGTVSNPPPKPVKSEMDPFSAQVAARLKEIFYAYWNRQERNVQATLGPSEIGSPCDRRLIMRLLGIPPVNPGGDGWAAFKGTQIHAGLAAMRQWADAGQGRFVVEMPLTFPSTVVPKGTGDALDRTLFLFADDKVMGRWSLNGLRARGPSPVYRTQIHVYAYGANKRGEHVEHVAVIGWPMESSSLDDLYVWSEPYDPSVAIAALNRAEELASWATRSRIDGSSSTEIARSARIDSSECRFCPFHNPDGQLEHGACNGS